MARRRLGQRPLTVAGLIRQLQQLDREVPGGIMQLPVFDIRDTPVQTTVYHDPDGDGTGCWVSVEPK